MQELNNTKEDINKNIFSLFKPDCGLFEAKSEADMDCNGKDGGCIGG